MPRWRSVPTAATANGIRDDSALRFTARQGKVSTARYWRLTTGSTWQTRGLNCTQRIWYLWTIWYSLQGAGVFQQLARPISFFRLLKPARLLSTTKTCTEIWWHRAQGRGWRIISKQKLRYHSGLHSTLPFKVKNVDKHTY